MTKEYVGEEFRAPFCEALAKGPVEWQWLESPEMWARGFGLPSFGAKTDYRLKPVGAKTDYRLKPVPKRMVTMYDKHGKPHQLVAPEREAPQIGQLIYRLGDATATKWLESDWQKHLLCQRLIFLTAEDAQAMAYFQREQRMGL